MKLIYINRNITLQRAGHDDVVLPKGNHTVADDVAEHPFVKHHTASATDAPDGLADLQALLEQTRIAAAAEIEQLKDTLARATLSMSAGTEHFRATIAEQQTTLAAAQATIAEQQTTLAAYAAMTPAVEPKGKAK